MTDGDESSTGGNPTYSFYLNEDNNALQLELKASRGGMAAILRKKFEVANVLIGLALIYDRQIHKRSSPNGSDNKDADEELREQVVKLTRALAPVLLPMIDGLNDLELEPLEQSDLIGQAV